MKELITLKTIPYEFRLLLLQELGYDSDGVYILQKNGERHLDRYINSAVKVDNMLIFPGSTIILDNNALSIAAYLEEFGDVF